MLGCCRRMLLAGLVVSVLVWAAPASSQVIKCSSNRTGGTFDDVIVSKKSCTLTGVTVRGSVLVSRAASLTLTGGTEVRGNVLVSSGGAISVGDATVLGDISLIESGNLTVGAGASTGPVRLEKSGSLSIAGGSVASAVSKESAGITLTDARVFPGGVALEKSTGSLRLCGSEIGLNSDLLNPDVDPDVDPETDETDPTETNETENDLGQGSGGITLLETTGDLLAVESATCAASQIRGSVSVGKGTGDVRLLGATVDSGDLSVFEQDGEVEVDGAVLSDVVVEKTKGEHVWLRNVTTDSDTTISGNEGDVTIEASTLGSDVKVDENAGDVELRGISVALEDVLVSKNGGDVVIDSSCDFALTVAENQNVAIENNNPAAAEAAGATCSSGYATGFGLTDVDVSKNGHVRIVGNTGELLKCADNASVQVEGNGFTFTECDDD